MAKYVVVNSTNSIVGIAENDTHKSVWENFPSAYSFIQISDDDFLKLKNHEQFIVSTDGVNVVYETLTGEKNESQEAYELYINDVKNRLTNFINGHPNSQLKTDATNYLNYLNNTFDISTITFPVNVNLNKYFSDNNIPFLSPLQIP
jgi:hypothetical protein